MTTLTLTLTDTEIELTAGDSLDYKITENGYAPVGVHFDELTLDVDLDEPLIIDGTDCSPQNVRHLEGWAATWEARAHAAREAASDLDEKAEKISDELAYAKLRLSEQERATGQFIALAEERGEALVKAQRGIESYKAVVDQWRELLAVRNEELEASYSNARQLQNEIAALHARVAELDEPISFWPVVTAQNLDDLSVLIRYGRP